MKQINSKWRLGAFTALIALLLTYQNCAQNPDTTSQLSSYLDNLPFAYNAKIDTLAYMSCSNMSDGGNPNAYFTVRAGAYNNATGGIALTPDFIAATQYYKPIDRAHAFGQSALNTDTRLNFSIRSRSNLQASYTASASTNTTTTGSTSTTTTTPTPLASGYSIDSFLPPLASDDISGPLSTNTSGQMMNYFPGINTDRLMEASLRFLTLGEGVAKEVRNNLAGAGASPSYAVVGYSNSSDEVEPLLRVPPAPIVAGTTLKPSNAYGYGYTLSFRTFNGSGGSRLLANINGVAEVDLTTGRQVASTWSCDTTKSFMIVRPEDVNVTVTCNTQPDSYSTTTQQAALTAIRRVLRVEDWFVDLVHQCVVPKNDVKDICYNSYNGGSQTVSYSGGSALSSDGVTTMACDYGQYTSYNSTQIPALCPHFVSVCVRN